LWLRTFPEDASMRDLQAHSNAAAACYKPFTFARARPATLAS
jgi:hypothetical protein